MLRQDRWGFLISGIVVLLTLFLLTYPSRVSQNQPEPPDHQPDMSMLTPELYYPVSGVVSAEEAISQSRAEFPQTLPITTSEAKLVSLAAFTWWSNFGDEPRTEESGDLIDWVHDPERPIWLVALLSPSLTVDQIFEGAVDTRVVGGAYYAWDASTGKLVENGALMDTSPQNYATFTSLQAESIPIVTVAAIPVYGVDSVSSPPTASTEEVATAIAIATILAGGSP
jgi:hypothetical protein